MNRLLVLLLLVLLSGCSFGSEKEKVKINTEPQELVIEKSFLWERISAEDYVTFAADMRCSADEFPSYSDRQLALLSEIGSSPEQYDYEGARPDWFTEYSKTGLEEKVQNLIEQKCSDKV